MSWLMILVGGLLSSSLCVGMCGGFALTLGCGVASVRTNLGRQLIYSLGRVFTYCACGAAAGYAGFRLANALQHLADVQVLRHAGTCSVSLRGVSCSPAC
jgi:hypothetical protein